MSNSDYKIYFLNSFTMILSFSSIESALKIILLLISIFYTGLKVIEMLKKKNDNKTDNF